MSVCEILLHQEEDQGRDRMRTVADLMRAAPKAIHAGQKDLDYWLSKPERIPEVLLHKHSSGSLRVALFCGSVYRDERDNEYVTALYSVPRKGFVTEKCWLSDPITASFYLAILG